MSILPIILSSSQASGTNMSSPTVRGISNDRRSRYPPRRTIQPSSRPLRFETLRFEGRCEDLKGHIYDSVDARQADQYTKTTNEITEFIGRTYKFGMDTRLSIENLHPIVIPEPEDPPENATRTQIRIWER